VVVEDGEAVTLLPVVADRPVEGAHVYVVPPVPLITVELPLQIVAAPVAAIGGLLMVTVLVAVLLQPLRVPVTV
jgi:hypothetical protein